ncbi:hypothetical protein DKX38_015572 [Salix brachista]|uniref:UDP-3-O-acyl-N-acetylglucosamine deacetylase n=1 Tax=Salix brachista TaxID=2182728 RepID=A0A5N5L5L7_9ROSI|nr:hypothetical protein DKX38_015572 [Salix brachista]
MRGGKWDDTPLRKIINTSIDYAQESPLCTTLSNDGVKIRTVEHLLSALEAMSVDNCRIEITNLDSDDSGFDCEVPILDGSAREWVERIEKDGLVAAKDECGNDCEKLAPYLNEPVHVSKSDSFVAAFPSPKVRVSYGIDFPQVAIGSQWFSSAPLEDSFYAKEIASSRTFCIYEEVKLFKSIRRYARVIRFQILNVGVEYLLDPVEHMLDAGLIKGGSLDNAIVCSASKGWLNAPLRFSEEPCRHKILDLVGDLSLFARFGNQGLPVAHIVVYKASIQAYHSSCAYFVTESENMYLLDIWHSLNVVELNVRISSPFPEEPSFQDNNTEEPEQQLGLADYRHESPR